MTNTLHLLTAYSPLWILIVGGILLLAGILLKTESYLKIANWLIWLGVIVSLFTGAMGGASMSKTMLVDRVNNSSLHLHAWTSAVAIILFLSTAWLFLRRKRFLRQNKPIASLNILLIVSLAVLTFFLIWTIQIAHHIRM